MEEPLSDFTLQRFPQSSRKRSKRRLLIPVIFILILIGVAIMTQKFLSPSKTSIAKPTATPAPTENIFPTDTPVPTSVSSPTPTQKPSQTPKPTVSAVDKKTGLDRSALDVAVENGSGKTGEASKMSEALRGFGYHVTSVGNANSYDYEGVTITVTDGKKEYLPLLQSDLATIYTVSSASATLSASSSAGAVVIVGK